MSYMDLRCPLDDFELVLFSTGAKGRAYPVCPYCFSNPPFEGMTKGTWVLTWRSRIAWFSFLPRGAAHPHRFLAAYVSATLGQGCNGCLHPTCEHSAIRLGVCTCVECGVGLLVIDETRCVPVRVRRSHRQPRSCWSQFSRVKARPGMTFAFLLHVALFCSHPRWRLACNSCNAVLQFPDKMVHSLKASTKVSDRHLVHLRVFRLSMALPLIRATTAAAP